MTIKILKGDITRQTVDAIINYANSPSRSISFLVGSETLAPAIDAKDNRQIEGFTLDGSACKD